MTRSPRNFISPLSAKRRTQRRAYIKAKARFLAAHPWCAWGLAQVPPKRIRASAVHHVRGRAGALLLDERFWLAVSQRGHRAIHDAPVVARELGLICPLGSWGRR